MNYDVGDIFKLSHYGTHFMVTGIEYHSGTNQNIYKVKMLDNLDGYENCFDEKWIKVHTELIQKVKTNDSWKNL